MLDAAIVRPVAAPPVTGGRTRPGFAPGERVRLAGFYGCIAALHVLGWGLFVYYLADYPSLTGLGFAAYLLGLRHAFDADHIAAVDDTVRFMLHKGKQPLGIGFFFSLGHSTIVMGLAVAVILSASGVRQDLPFLQNVGGLIGAGVSGTFLWIIGIMNLMVLLDLLSVYTRSGSGRHDHTHVEELLRRRGFLNRFLGRRLQKIINHSWQMYPLGLLFGLGFDTASEVGLLAMSATAAMGDLPTPAVLSLPVLFAAGMSMMDTTDGVFMCKAYEWSFINPARKMLYNLTTTSLSIAVALVIGTLELIRVLAGTLHPKGALLESLDHLYLGSLGYMIVGLFVVAWGVSLAIWKVCRIRERLHHEPAVHSHEHTHAGGLKHSHRHFIG